MAAKFSLGVVVATPDSLTLLDGLGISPNTLLSRHAQGDWGLVPKEDARENERSIKNGWRILSAYEVGDDGERVWIITEADRSSTCLLLPEEY